MKRAALVALAVLSISGCIGPVLVADTDNGECGSVTVQVDDADDDPL